MAITHVFAGIPTAGFEPALAWYERLLGRAPDRFPKDEEAVWQLTDTGLIYLVGDAKRAGTALLTLIVDDLDERVAELRSQGITPAPIETIPGAVRRVAITDPDGNQITLGELITKSS